MSVKRIIVPIVAIIFVFVAGYYLAAFNFKQHLSAYEKRISAISRSRNSNAVFKEIELLVTLHNGYLNREEKSRDVLCKLIMLKVKQMSEDRELIMEGLRSDNEKENAKFAEGAKVFNNISDRELEVAINTAKQIGCN
jgi:hypothetical protein